MPIHKKISELTRKILNDIPNSFDGNELAYITLQSKNELQIRDKFAWKMQCALDKEYGYGKYGVRREWSESKRRKVDIAILQFQNGKPKNKVIALMEFKAHHSLNNEKWPLKAFCKDVKKMKNMCSLSCQGADLYFIFLHTGIGKKPSLFIEMATYNKFYTNCKTYPSASYKKDLAKYWQNMFYQNKSITYTRKVRIKPSKPIVAPIGISFGVDLYLSSMVWGPVKSNSITI